MSLVFVDVETTGLDPSLHSVWEVAFAVDDGPILSSFVAHSTEHADPEALAINGYLDRFQGAPNLGLEFERQLRGALTGNTLVAANPAFDAAFLRARWGVAPWKYRLLDVEAYAMPYLDLDVPVGLARIADLLGIDAPDHTAATDVAVLRACFNELKVAYAGLRDGAAV